MLERPKSLENESVRDTAVLRCRRLFVENALDTSLSSSRININDYCEASWGTKYDASACLREAREYLERLDSSAST